MSGYNRTPQSVTTKDSDPTTGSLKENTRPAVPSSENPKATDNITSQGETTADPVISPLKRRNTKSKRQSINLTHNYRQAPEGEVAGKFRRKKSAEAEKKMETVAGKDTASRAAMGWAFTKAGKIIKDFRPGRDGKGAGK